MLEAVIKTLLLSIIISFFFIYCLRIIDQSTQDLFTRIKHAGSINELNNLSFFDPGFDGYRLVNGEGSLVVCKPSLINNHPGRVCFAS